MGNKIAVETKQVTGFLQPKCVKTEKKPKSPPWWPRLEGVFGGRQLLWVTEHHDDTFFLCTFQAHLPKPHSPLPTSPNLNLILHKIYSSLYHKIWIMKSYSLFLFPTQKPRKRYQKKNIYIYIFCGDCELFGGIIFCLIGASWFVLRLLFFFNDSICYLTFELRKKIFQILKNNSRI